MKKVEREALEELKRQRIEALKALGHSGEHEKHSKGRLRHLATFGLVYEKTARHLMGDIAQEEFRSLVLPDQWIENPVYSTAPKVPVYDPRVLLRIKRMLDERDEEWLAQCRRFIGDHRREMDEEVRQGYREFVMKARLWRESLEERRRLGRR